MTVDEIRQKFPNPVAAVETHTPATYCVLGAALLARDPNASSTITDIRFPKPWFAAIALGISYANAEYIAGLNDAGKFDEAWEWLSLALTGQGFQDED